MIKEEQMYSKRTKIERCERVEIVLMTTTLTINQLFLEFMNNKRLPKFSECSQESALESMFLNLSMQRSYLEYVGRLIEGHVENTNASNPFDYCKSLSSPPANLPYADQNGMGQWDMNQEENVTLDQLPSVSQDDIFDIVDQIASSSV